MQLTTKAMPIRNHRVVEVFQQLVDGGRFVSHQVRRVF
jgi:hypothetical protein